MNRNKIKMNKNLLIVLVFLLFNIGYGQKIWTGATSTAWETDSNWSPVGKPTAGENVLIKNAANQPVINVAGAACAILELSNSTPGSMVVLTVKAGSFSPASITMNSTGDTSNCSLKIGAGTVNVTGDITMTGNALQNNVTFYGESILKIGGMMNGGTLNADGIGTVNYSAAGSRTIGTYVYNNLILSGSGVKTVATSGVVVNGTLTMSGTATASSAPTYGANAALKYSSLSPQTVGPEWLSPFVAAGGVEVSTANPAVSVVTINGNGTEKRFNDGVPLIIDEDALLVITNSELYLGGDFINNRGSLNTDKFVYLTGSVNQSIDSFISTQGISMIKNAGIATFTGNINTKKLTLNGLGTLSLGTGLTHIFTSDWTRTQGTLNAGSSILKILGNVVGNAGTFNAGTGTVEFNGGPQNLGSGSITYNNLILSGSAIKTFGAKTTINETFSIVSGVIADLTANLVHKAKTIQLGFSEGAGGSWGSRNSNAVNKNDSYFVLNNGIVNVGPTIVIDTNNLAAFTTIYGTPSISNNFTISGTDMVQEILVTPPAAFEVSTDGTNFTDTVTFGAAGDIAVTKVYVRLKGTIAVGDYSGNLVLSSTGTANVNIPIATSTVNKALLTITANNNSTVYGSDNPVLTASYVGFVNGDTVANLITAATIATTATKASAAGTYPITVSGATSSNYTFTYAANAVLTITPAPLSITANNNSKVYGSDNPVLTASYVGFVNGDNDTNLATAAKIATKATKASAVGTYPITASGAVSSNYTITYGANAVLTITPADLSIVANNNSKVYGTDNPVLTASYVGFVNGDTVANLTTAPTITTTANKASAVGTYPITASGAVLLNYIITYGPNAILTITPADLSVVANNNSKVYGSDNPVLTASYVGFVNGDTVADLTTAATISTTATIASAVGTYPITASGVVSSNYNIIYGTNTALTVTPAELTITADEARKIHGDKNPTLTVKYSGFVNGDNENGLTFTKPVITTTAVTESAIGEYPITVAGASSSNYNIKFVGNVLNVVASNNAGLSDIDVSKGDLDPTFDTDKKGYTVEVPNDIDTYVINPIPSNPNSTVTMTVDGVIIDPTAPLDLKVGDNVITIVVTAEDGITQETYEVIVTREPSSNAGLIDLAISEGTLSPTFAEGILDYTTTVPNDITSIKVTPVSADPTAIITVNGIVVPSGTASPDQQLKVGENEITTIVTAQDGTIQTYTVIVTREEAPLSNNAGLTDLAISEGTLSPIFDEGTKDYTTTVPNDVKTISVTPVSEDATATITVNGIVVPSGTASPEQELKVGKNEIITVVTAQDGTVQTYIVIVTREEAPLSNDAALTDLAISEGTLSPAFAEGTKDYTTIVPNDITSIKVTPVSEDATATITVNGIVVPSGTASADLPLKVGENVIITTVTAQDGTVNTYTIIVTREEATAPDNAGLSDIVISDGALSPAFNTDTNDYRVDVPNETNSYIVNPIAIDPNATIEIKVDGKIIDPKSPIDLNVGDNVITVVVTAPDGTQDTYVVIVNRADAEPQAIIPSNIITPNGDGKNDYWIIDGLDKYPNNSVKVFDRAARLVYSKNNYNNDWDGSYKGSPVNEDTYYYLIDLGNGSPKIKGFISIIRN
ncbi:cadherin-like beta sandwich domain-containing protein [Flavobacterium psychroterrae]|uniref:Cadherin-like beta sandwich domain-containing protein n=1 Tax=Flavobacterium psychroterrae TaxID=2133767 RepID=A0ABS5PH90_9FLAO|nr:MBG domain-containing protein [Flavobacterium psychroterrae]MBS7233200.1 cadherin-like beta sandwich domain-containing protein [Flavobacterium psychroterrae]